MKKKLAVIACTVSLLISLTAGAAHADDAETDELVFGTASATTTVVPKTMSDQEISAYGGSGFRAMAAGDFCNIVPGQMWKRTSGSGYRFGTVGGKPRMANCTSGVRSTKLESYVYKRVGWAQWTQVAGPFVSRGTGNMQQLSVQYICKGLDQNAFQVIIIGTGTNSRGQTSVGRDSTGSYTLSCS